MSQCLSPRGFCQAGIIDPGVRNGEKTVVELLSGTALFKVKGRIREVGQAVGRVLISVSIGDVMSKKAIFLSLMIVGTLSLVVAAQDEPATVPSVEPPMELTDNIPLDPNLVYGQFENGLTYYIKSNARPEKRVELRLVVNAGSVLENESQRGLAHFVEHMCFNGTENFAKQELIDYLESIGIQFGPDINAYTAFDETVYMLQIPTDSLSQLETAFQILEEWAHRVSFEDEEIDRERGVILEERRLGLGAGTRMRDKQFPILFKDSRYSERLPIGLPEVVEGCSYDTLKQFYRDWYRPDLMAVIAVGDIDPEYIKGLIEKHFASIPARELAREREVFEVPDHEQTLYAIAADPEATGSRVAVYYKHPLSPRGKVADYRESIVAALYNYMLSQRLFELTRKADPPFIYAYSNEGRLVRSRETYMLGAGVREEGIARGLEALLIEAARVREHGFVETEMERQKAELLRYMEQAFKERDKTESAALAAEYSRNFLEQEPIPGIAYEFAMYNRYLPTITLEEINALAHRWITEDNRVVMVNMPEKPDLPVPTEQELAAVFDRIDTMTIAPYEDIALDQPLVSQSPEPSAVVAEQYIEPLDITHWTLANGVEVLVKPTDFKNDEIIFQAFSPGGYWLLDESDHIPALTASDIVSQGGLGDFDQTALDKKLAGKLVGINAWIGNVDEEIGGRCAPGDLETLFELIYLKFTAPRKDTAAFQAYRSRLETLLANRSASPAAVYQDTLMVTLSQHHPRVRPWDLAMLDDLDLNRSMEIYRDRFADASDFTFVFVGNVDLEKLRPLAETYLGGLPSLRLEESWQDVGVRPPKGVVKREVRKGLEPKSQVQLIFTGDFVWNRRNRYDITAMASAFQIKLREILREDLSGTYGVGVNALPTLIPNTGYRISIGFGCGPDRVDELIGTVFTQIDSLKAAGLDQGYIDKVKEMQRRDLETSLKENNYWLSILRRAYTYQEDPLNVLEYQEMIESLTVESVRAAAERYFDLENYVQVVLLPEK